MYTEYHEKTHTVRATKWLIALKLLLSRSDFPSFTATGLCIQRTKSTTKKKNICLRSVHTAMPWGMGLRIYLNSHCIQDVYNSRRKPKCYDGVRKKTNRSTRINKIGSLVALSIIKTINNAILELPTAHLLFTLKKMAYFILLAIFMTTYYSNKSILSTMNVIELKQMNSLMDEANTACVWK